MLYQLSYFRSWGAVPTNSTLAHHLRLVKAGRVDKASPFLLE